MNAGRADLVCSDLDGTLLSSSGDLPAVTARALERARSAGLPVAVVTGRPARDALDWAAGAGFDGLLACGNGAVVWDVGRRVKLYEYYFAPDRLLSAFLAIRRALPDALLGVDGEHSLILEPGFAEAVPDCWPHIQADPVKLASAAGPAVKILVACQGLSAERIGTALSGATMADSHVTYSNPRFLEISPRDANKGRALRHVADHLGIAAERTAAVGDMPNDLPMLRAAGLPAAVSNAHPDVRKAARVVLPSNDQGGVAELIDRLLAGPSTATEE